MLFTYAGVDIRLGPIGTAGTNTHHVGAEQRYDESGVDYLTTRYTFDVTGVVNLASMSYTRQAGGGPPQAQAGTAAALTVAAIRDALSQPRQSLVYKDQFGNVLLQSPAINPNAPAGGPSNVPFACDCTGGPFVVRAPEILKVFGDKTMLVRVVVRTDVNESFLLSANPPYLTSNRWSVAEDFDDCAFSTLSYGGTTVFRADVLGTKTVQGTAPGGALGPRRPLVPDDLRDYFQAVQIPAGYKRTRVWTKQRADGFTVDWQVVDEQRAVTLNVYDAMDIECVQTDGVRTEGVEAFLTKGVGRLGDATEFFLNADNWVRGRIGDGARQILGLAKPFVDALPRWSTHVVITAHGHPGASRRKLARLCVYVLEAVVKTVERGIATTNISLTQDKMGKWIRLECDVRRGPAQSTYRFPTSTGSDLFAPTMLDVVPDDDGINFALAAGGNVALTQAAPGTWPPFPGDQGVRGTALEVLLAQVLLNPYQAPPKPPIPAVAAQGQQPQ